MNQFVGSGVSAGVATGRIELDISQLESAAAQARALGQMFERALGNVDNGAKRAQSTFQQLNAGISSLRGELLSIGAGGGILTGLGLNGAQSLRNYTIAFRQFTDSQKEAVDLTNHLIELANKYGLEWEGVAQLGRSLLPNLKNGTAELDAWISRAVRLRSLNPQATKNSESIAIGEFRTGNTRSLALRFNVPLDVIREATSLYSDYGQALDYILERQGATEDAAIAMANAFVGVRNELRLVLAQGFMPLFEALRPILGNFREWLTAVRESNPALLTAGAGLTALAAAGAPAVLMFNQLVSAAEKLKALGVLGVLGRVGGVGLAAGAGVALGIGATNAIGEATGNERLQNAELADLGQILQKLLFNIAFTLNRSTQIFVETAAYVKNSFYQMIAGMLSAVSSFTRGLAGALPAGMGGDRMNQMAAGLDLMAQMAVGAGKLAQNQAAQFTKQNNEWMRNWAQSIIAGGNSDLDVGARVQAEQEAAKAQLDIKLQWAQATRKIESDAAAQRLQAKMDYERQRSDTISQYELGISREAADYARGRQRQTEQLAQQIAELQANAAKREAQQIREFNEQLAELRADGNERIAKLEADYADDREKAERDHRSRLMSAAARLDAVGVFEEQRRFQIQQEEDQKAFTERLKTEKDNLAERLQEEEQAHADRLQSAREADAERLADMQSNFAEQRQLEEEERAIRLARQAEDHRTQLAQMATAQAERLAQINSQAAREKAALDESFLQQLADLGVYNSQWMKIQQARQDASIKLFDTWWEEINKRFAEQGPQPRQIGPQPQTGGWPTDFVGGRSGGMPKLAWPSSFANGGWVERDGWAQVHAGEYVTKRADAQRLAAGKAVTTRDINVSVTALPGMDEQQLAVAMRRSVVDMLEELAR